MLPPLSILDLSITADGQSSAQALEQTTTFAIAADQLGFKRFWVAEHHNMATVASTSPAVLIAHLASVTTRIHVGSGGVMLPNHSPLVIAEQFAMLEALHGQRIDLGIGRAPGGDRFTAHALRATTPEQEQDFPRDLITLMGLLGDTRADSGPWDRLKATPLAVSFPEIILLGSSDFSASLAATLGLGFSFANHFDMGGTQRAIEIYRQNFVPLGKLAKPYLIISATVIGGQTYEEADLLAAPARLRRLGIRTGQMMPVLAPEQAVRHELYPTAKAMPTNSIIGTREQLRSGLSELAALTGADEIMLHVPTFCLEDRISTIEMLAAN